MKKLLTICGIALFLALSVNGREQEKLTYKTTKVTPNDVLVTCRDGSTPRIKLLNDGRFILVSCSQ